MLAKARTIMVTGTGGIGWKLGRQIAVLKPKLFVVLDHSENQVFEIENELHRRFPTVPVAPVNTDIRDQACIARVY